MAPVPRLTRFSKLVGIRIVAMHAGHAAAALDVKPVHKNRRGVMHGGAVASLLDTAMGAATISAMTPEEWCATITLTIQYVAGASGGVLHATGDVVRRTRRVAFVHGEVRDQAGDVCATASGVWYIWPSKPPAPAIPPAAAKIKRARRSLPRPR